MAVGKVLWSILDFAGEVSTHALDIVQLTAGNISATTTLIGNYLTALDGITLGRVAREIIQAANVDISAVLPSSPFAQREIKWVVIVQDAEGNKFKANELPTANLDLLENNSKYLVKSGNVVVTTSAVAVQAFIDAYEAFAVGNTGLALTVWDVYQVGRNN